jgi:hypothetical protein
MTGRLERGQVQLLYRRHTAYVTWPADHASGTSERIEFMADGCFATLEPWLPAYCRVDESNERNNTRSRTVTVA